MRPEVLMKFGAAVALFGLAGTIFAPVEAQFMTSILMAMGGVLFGKGYGVWEERNK